MYVVPGCDGCDGTDGVVGEDCAVGHGVVSAYALRAVMSRIIPAVRNASRANMEVDGGRRWLGGRVIVVSILVARR